MDTSGTGTRVTAPPPPPQEQPLGESDPQCYVVTAHRPSAVLASVVCAFTSPEDLNLIISKVTRMEIHRVRQDGLEGIADVPIYGRVAALKVLHPEGRKTAVLLIVTESHQYALLEWAPAGHLSTLAVGDARVQVAQPRDQGPLVAVDPTGTVVAMLQYRGIIRVMQLAPDTCEVKVVVIERIDEPQVLDMQFLTPTGAAAGPVLGILHEDYRTKMRSFKTYAVTFDDGKPKLHDGDLSAKAVESGAAFIVPAHADHGAGVTLVGETSLTHLAQPADPKATAAEQHRETIPRNEFLCWARVDGTPSVLLADAAGRLHLMQLKLDARGRVSGVQVHSLGTATCAYCMSYLDAGVIFIGSRVGNSQLVRLAEKPQGPNQTFTQVLQEFTNLAPIVDFAVVDLDNVGQGQLVACCNTGTSGSLRLVRAGISIVEHAGIELEGIRGAWSVKGSTMAEHDQCLVITFLESTHVLAMNSAEELDEADVQGFVTDKMTLFCASLDNDHTLQVTSEEVRLLDISAGGVVGTWQCPHGPIAKAAATGACHILVATGQGRLYMLESSLQGLKCIAETEIGDEVACIDIASWTRTGRERLAAVGTWNSKLLLLEVPSMKIVAEEKLLASDLPRSILFMALGKGHALLVGMGDGQLAHWQVTEVHTLTTKKSVTLGLNPISLSAFRMNGCPYVFAATDRPAVVHEHNGKLVYSPLNESNVAHLCTFSTEALPGAVAMCKDDRLMITAIDAIQKLHIRTVPLQEQPRRIAYQRSTKAFAVVTLSIEQDACFVRILSQSSWETVASLQLEEDESASAVCSVVHPTTPDQELFVVGTGYVKEGESEPTRGRLLLLQLTGTPGGQQELKALFEQTVNGGVYSLAAIPACPGKFVATISSQVSVFGVDAAAPRGGSLKLLCKAPGMILALYADVSGHTIVVGDLMRSVAVYSFNPEKQELTLVAKDFDTKWTSSVAAISDTVFATTDNSNGLMVMRYNRDAEDDATKMALDTVLDFNMGDFVNRMRRGSLVMQLPDAEMASCPVYVAVSVLGMISLCIMLPPHRFQQLQALQAVMQSHVKGIGGLLHSGWRARSAADSRGDVVPAKCCIDGDLVEQLLDLPRDDMETIVSKIPEPHRLPLDELVKLIEELQRLH